MSDAAVRSGRMAYGEATALAASADGDARRRLAARADVHPEILYYLAEDRLPAVRRAIAANGETPLQADLLLARDADADVRCDVAGKVARLAPGLTGEGDAKRRQLAVKVLEVLARDQLARVRQLLAEALKDVARPPELAERVIGRLARDVEIAVAGPVLEHSPLLSDDDLLDIVAGTGTRGALAAIAARAGLSGSVADAIVGRAIAPDGAVTGEADAVTRLLGNASAQIREETLDRVVAAAPGQPAWHRPLVDRPKLPPAAIRRVAAFVADALLERLRARKDLDPATAKAVSQAVKARLDKGDDAKGAAAGRGKAQETAYEMARRLHAAGELDDEALSQALLRGKRAFVKAALAVRAQLPEAVVEKIIEARSGKGVAALAWKAGMDMRFAVQLQTRIAGIPPHQALNPRNGTDFPMSEKDMTWQIEFFGG